jgi:hypothetical protein
MEEFEIKIYDKNKNYTKSVNKNSKFYEAFLRIRSKNKYS